MKVKKKCALLVLAFCSFLSLRLYGQDSSISGEEPKAGSSSSSILAEILPRLPGAGMEWPPMAVNFTPKFSLRGAFAQAESEEFEEEPEYRGVGIHVSISGSLNYFGGGDIAKGSRGMLDRAEEVVGSLGYALDIKKTKAFNSGYGLGAEVAYLFTPRLGIGLRFSRSLAAHKSELWYFAGYLQYSSWAMPDLKANSFQLGLHYFWPLHRLLTLRASAGPEIHFAKYLYAFSMTTPELQETVQHTATTTRIGALGSLGLEIHMNNRVALVLEALGRIAKISNLKGTEIYYRWENEFNSESTVKGYLYYLSGEGHPRLAIFAAEPGGDQGARKATFDFSGVSLSGGLRFRF